MQTAKEILINAFAVSNKNHNKQKSQFEFIIDNNLKVLDCVQLLTVENGSPISMVTKTILCDEIYNVLFEVNHVRVNPNLNNNSIIMLITKTLTDLGVTIHNRPSEDSLAICFQPLGEIKDNVRFYIKEDRSIIFLAETARPKLVSCS